MRSAQPCLLFCTGTADFLGPWCRTLSLFLLLFFFLVCIFSPSLKALKHFLDLDLHPLFAIFPESMLAIHSIYTEMYRTLLCVSPRPWGECGPEQYWAPGWRTSINERLWWHSCCNPLEQPCIPYTFVSFYNRKGNCPSIWVEKEGFSLRGTLKWFSQARTRRGCNGGQVCPQYWVSVIRPWPPLIAPPSPPPWYPHHATLTGFQHHQMLSSILSELFIWFFIYHILAPGVTGILKRTKVWK